MQARLEAFLERVEHTKTFEDLQACVADLRGIFDVNHVVYHSVNREGQPYALATYDAEWAHYYESEKLYQIDPVVLSAFQRFHPFNWKSLDWDRKASRQFMRDAIDGGVGNQGLSLPIRGPHGEFALFSVSHACTDAEWLKFNTDNKPSLMIVGHYLHQAARRIEHLDQHPAHVTLSPREVDALAYLGTGLNRSRVAENLKISEHTLRVYIESARFKLGAMNTTHAVALALSRGLIAL
jgi:LuxR family transcriptional regulator, quorum-sensing system regulator RaiR